MSNYPLPEQMIEDIQNADGVEGGIKLNQLERERIDSIEDWLGDDKSLTETQLKTLRKLWDRI